jgi:hypothetical protein
VEAHFWDLATREHFPEFQAQLVEAKNLSQGDFFETSPYILGLGLGPFLGQFRPGLFDGLLLLLLLFSIK